jgi:hypothetical protein
MFHTKMVQLDNFDQKNLITKKRMIHVCNGVEYWLKSEIREHFKKEHPELSCNWPHKPKKKV